MSDEEKEYEVESIQEARVDKGKGKKSKPVWTFRVRWKDYGADDDTWEPIESFDKSKGIVDDFWKRTREGRDMRDISQFSVGEKFLPKGPPPRKLKKKSTLEAETSTQVATSSTPSRAPAPSTPEADNLFLDLTDIPTGKRRRGLVDVESPARPPKRQRERASSTNDKKHGKSSASVNQPNSKPETLSTGQKDKSRKKPREPSSEIVPDSDEEVEQAIHVDNVDSEASRSVHGPTAHGPAPPSPPASDSPAGKSTPDSLFDDQPEIEVTSHRLRARKAKPFVESFEEPALTRRGGQLSAKLRAVESKRSEAAVASSSSASAHSKQRAGPGRPSSGLKKKNVASLLTADPKGTLKIVKGSYSRPAEKSPEPYQEQRNTTEEQAMDECVTPEDPPTAAELLALGGLDAQEADALPEFEDSEPASVTATNGDASSARDATLARERAESLNKAKESLFPTSMLSGEPPSPWKRPTIFGPLTAVKQSTPSLPMEADPNQPNHSPFSLNLDSTTSVPVLFTDIVPGGSSLVPEIHVNQGNISGHFYASPVESGALLDAVRSLGIAGRVLVRRDASAELKQHFLRFSRRLQNGDLFVAPAGLHVYAFCSSDSQLLCSRMNISPGLQVAEGQVLVCKIVVDNFSGYAEVAGKADSRQWSQYVESLA